MRRANCQAGWRTCPHHRRGGGGIPMPRRRLLAQASSATSPSETNRESRTGSPHDEGHYGVLYYSVSLDGCTGSC